MVLVLWPSASYAQINIFPCVVDRVIDGDTITCDTGSRHYRIRLIGVEAFERKLGKRAEKQAEQFNIPVDEVIIRGEKAKRYLESILPYPTLVFIETDTKLYSFSRLLGYIWKGSDMVNVQMLRSGYVFIATYENKKYQKLFDESVNH